MLRRRRRRGPISGASARRGLEGVGAGLEGGRGALARGRRGTCRRARPPGRTRSRARRRRSRPQRRSSSLASAREVLVAVDVELEHVGRSAAAARGALGHPPHAAEARQHHLGARVLGPLGDREGDAAPVDDAGDQDPLALEDHRNTSLEVAARRSRRSAVAGAAPPDAAQPGAGDRLARLVDDPPAEARRAPVSSSSGLHAVDPAATRIVSPIRTGRLKTTSLEAAQRDAPASGSKRHQPDA